MEYFLVFIGAFIASFIGAGLAVLLVRPQSVTGATPEIPIVSAIKSAKKERDQNNEQKVEKQRAMEWLYGTKEAVEDET